MKQRKNKRIDITKEIEFDPDNIAIDIIKGDFFLKECQAMSDFLKELNIPEEQYNKLIPRLVDHAHKMRLDGFMQCLTKQFKIIDIKEQ